MKYIQILLIVGLSSLHYVAKAQKPKGNWSIGLTGSVDYFIRTLIDVERFNLDSTLLIGITDAEYLAKREEIDKPYFPGKMAGFLLSYKILLYEHQKPCQFYAN